MIDPPKACRAQAFFIGSSARLSANRATAGDLCASLSCDSATTTPLDSARGRFANSPISPSFLLSTIDTATTCEGRMTAGQSDRYLTVVQAVEVLRALGFDVTYHRVRRYATERKLPFFRFGAALYISETELIQWFRSKQLQAARNVRIRGARRRED